jgi:selenocysteine lyase/cysteine desulfurase
MTRKRPVQLDQAREAVAKLLNVPRKECVFVRNATTGIDTVLRNLVFKEGDVIIYFATVHGGVENAIVYMTQMTPVRTVKVQYQLPVTHDEIVKRFRDAVTQAQQVDGLNVRAAVFDTVVSHPAVRFPFERLIEACREERILSVVDGAHAIGQIALDLGKLQPDFFVSNCYK